jgi:uncharacterized protein (DUF952 family)
MSMLDTLPPPDQNAQVLYHMLPEEEWLRALVEQSYTPKSLAEEGFIHLSPTPEVTLQVANHFYAGEPGAWVVLLLDATKISAPVQWDAVGETFFPHIYGPLNLDAVTEVVAFPRAESGIFLPLGG